MKINDRVYVIFRHARWVVYWITNSNHYTLK